MAWSKRTHTKRNMALGTLVGAVTGYLTGLLTAPRSGRETREDIANKVGDAKEGTEEQLKGLSDDLQDLIKATRTRTIALSSQAREEFNEAVIKAKDAQNKAATVLKSVKAGKADDPQLNKAIKQAKLARKNLAKYLKG